MLLSFSNASHLIFQSPTEPGTHVFSQTLLASELRGSPVLPSVPSAGIRGTLTCLAFLCWFWPMNACPCGCAAHTLLTEPFPWPLM